jgi:ABC-type polysaccharide/polyol phosphate export permease
MGLALLMLPATIVLTSMFVLGMSLILATGAMVFPDVLPLWDMLLPVLMFTTPAVYPAAILPERLRALQSLNPMTCFIEAFRAPLYSNTAPVRSLVIMLVIAVAALAAGWLLFTRSADEMAYRA